MKSMKHYLHDSFLRTHVNYIQSINKAWQTGQAELIYSFINKGYEGDIFSNSFGCLHFTKADLIEAMNETIKQAWNMGVQWEAKKRMALSNISGDEIVISYRLLLHYPSLPVQKGVAMMVEMWKYEEGAWTLWRDIQEERDQDIQRFLYSSTFMRDHTKFFSAFIQVKQGVIDKEIILPYISENFEGKISMSKTNRELSINDLLSIEENVLVKEYKKNYICRNKREVILHHVYMKTLNEHAYEVISSEAWKWRENKWVLMRCFQEYLEIEKHKEKQLFY